MANVQNSSMKVTIALSTYNVAPYLKESLDRMVGQTLKNIEILCIDDASTDGTLDILYEYARQDSRVRVVETEVNAGLAVSRNRALELARGEYICFVDGDDLMDFNLMECAYDLAKREEADMVMWDYYEFGEQLFQFIPRERPSSLLGISPDDRHTLVKRMAFTWVRLLKTQAIRNLGIHFPEGRTKQDQPVHWLTVTCLPRIALLSERKYGYRISRNQTSARKGRVMLDMAYVPDYTEKVLREKGVLKEYEPEFRSSQLSLWQGMYFGIKTEYRAEALAEIRRRYAAPHRQALKNGGRQQKWFYLGIVEGKKTYAFASKLESALRAVCRKVRH